MKPRLNPCFLHTAVSDGAVVYDPQSDQLHRLNPVAAIVLEFCDGTRGVDEVTDRVLPLLPDGSRSVVQKWVDSAIDAHVLVDGVNSDVTTADEAALLSADDLSQLAERLREHGKVRTAFICQQRAAELVPKDAHALHVLGELAHIIGRRDDARNAYQRYLELRPEDAEIAHLLTALSDEAAPDRVPDACIEQLYERFSSFYDENLYEELGSEVPGRLAQLVTDHIKDRTDQDVLDLGCGTGAFGAQIRPLAARLVGIDLSAEMVELARRRNIYDQLDVAEITAWLRQCDDDFDLIAASDSFIYFGDLAQVIVPAAKRLKPLGVIAFSVEASDDRDYSLTDSGRYIHHADHIRRVAKNAGLDVVCAEQAFLRMEYGQEVSGHYVLLRHAPGRLPTQRAGSS